MADPRVMFIAQGDAREFHEGPEVCREYVREHQMWFGTSNLQPGEQGALDPGHMRSIEVFFCAAGQVAVRTDIHEYGLQPGDAIVIAQGVPHTLMNVGSQPALVVWAGAPGGA